MRRRFETILLWLVLVALPLQGIASATMLFCTTAHRAPEIADGHHHVGTESDHGESSSVDALLNDTADHVAHQHGPEHDSSKCAGCAPCSIGASMVASSPTLFTSFVKSAEPQAAGPISFPRYSTDGPDRPPRYVLA